MVGNLYFISSTFCGRWYLIMVLLSYSLHLLICSVSTEGMRTINPMETIPEDILTRSNRYINHVTGINTPFTVSPQPSPSKQKRFQQNLTIGMRSPNSISKSTMEGLPVRSQSGRFHIQPANQALTCKAQSYIEHWLHRADNKQSATLQPDTPTTDGLLSRPLSLFQSVTHDDGSMVFSIDMDAPKETKSEVVPSPRQEHINFIPEKQTTDCPVRRPHIQMSSEDVRTTGEPTSGVQANSAQVAATDNSQIGEKPAECSSSDDDRSRHTSSSDGSFCYGQKNGNGLVTVSSLTPLLRDMETQLPVSNAWSKRCTVHLTYSHFLICYHNFLLRVFSSVYLTPSLYYLYCHMLYSVCCQIVIYCKHLL